MIHGGADALVDHRVLPRGRDQRELGILAGVFHAGRIEVDDAQAGHLDDADVFVALDHGHVAHRHVNDHVDGAGHHVGRAGAGVGDRLVDDVLGLGLGAPVGFVALEDDAVAAHVLGQRVLAGADGMVGVVIVVVGFAGLLVEDHHVLDVGQQQHVGRLAGDFDGVIVDLLALVDSGERVNESRLAGRIGALEREQHVVGVESVAVVERDAFAQMERPDRSVFVGLPALGQKRLRFDLPVKGHERLEDVFHNGVVEVFVQRVGIERIGVARQADRHVPRARRAGGRSPQRQSGQRAPQSTFLHGNSLLIR